MSIYKRRRKKEEERKKKKKGTKKEERRRKKNNNKYIIERLIKNKQKLFASLYIYTYLLIYRKGKDWM